MSMPMGELSGDTDVTDGMRRPDLRPESDSAIPRPWPTDPPGAGGGGGWPKIGAPAADGWDRIDDVGDDGAAMWKQT